MKITPLDIKKQEFARKFRGYSREEVQSYLENIANEFEAVLKKNLALEEKLSSLEVRLSSYTGMENVLQDTLVTTQKSAEELKAAAQRKAKAVIDEARVAANRLMADARADLLKVQREVEDLKNQKARFIVEFKSLLDTQHAMLDIIRKKGEKGSDFEPVRMRPDITDEELNRVVNEFQKEISMKDSPGENENLPQGEADS